MQHRARGEWKAMARHLKPTSRQTPMLHPRKCGVLQFNINPRFARAHIAQARARALKVQASAFSQGRYPGMPHPRDHQLELPPIPTTAFIYCSVSCHVYPDSHCILHSQNK